MCPCHAIDTKEFKASGFQRNHSARHNKETLRELMRQKTPPAAANS